MNIRVTITKKKVGTARSSYPREAAGLGAAELQAPPVQRALPRVEAAQGAAPVLQDVR